MLTSRLAAAVFSAGFFLVAPGTVAGWIPYWLTNWESHNWYAATIPARIVGVVLIACGLSVLVHSFYLFVVRGHGTPAPVMPPTRLVVHGFYRFVRNPMYVALLMLIVGEALLLGRFILLGYAAAVWVVCHLFAILYEERKLRRTFGASYDDYRAAVPRWWPRLTPWSPSGR